MPDHLHLLAEGTTTTADCRKFVSRAKQYSGFYFKQTFRKTLWQRYGYERVLRSEDASLSVARYILENPVRARLVTRATDYPFTGSDRYSIAEILEAAQLDSRWSG
jgi:putative transposase